MKGLSPDTARKLILSVGTRRSGRPLSPVEVAGALQQVLDAGTDVGELAGALYLDGPTMIRRFTRLLALPLEIQPLVEWGSGSGTLSFTAASELARLEKKCEQLVLAKAVLENQFSKTEVKQIVETRRRLGKSVDDSIRAVLEQRPVIERRHVIIGELLLEQLQERLKQVPQHERNSLLRRVIEHYGPSTASFGAKLGHKHFILVGDDQFYAAITSLPGGFEEAITEYLMSELSVVE